MAKRARAGKTNIKKFVVSLPLFIYQTLGLFSKPSKKLLYIVFRISLLLKIFGLSSWFSMRQPPL